MLFYKVSEDKRINLLFLARNSIHTHKELKQDLTNAQINKLVIVGLLIKTEINKFNNYWAFGFRFTHKEEED